MGFYFLGSILSLTLWLYLTFCHGKRNILKNLNFWSNRIVFENVKFNSKNNNVHDKICVIIPARNEEKTIIKTLKSLKVQKINNLEVIVIDDNSTDNTSKIVNNFKKLKFLVK